MAQYGINNNLGGTPQVLAAAAKSIVIISAATATLRRAFISECKFGAAAVPSATDCEIVWDLIRTNTALGTTTTVTPSPVDAADTAAGTVGSANNTAEPTLGVLLDVMAVNQRNSQQWIARDDKARLVVPAVNLNGIAMRARSSTYVGTVAGSLKFEE